MQHIHLPWTFCEDLSHDYVLPDDEFRHLFHVLRVSDDAGVVSFDGCGRLRLGRVCFGKKSGKVAFTEPVFEMPAPKKTFSLVQCLPNNVATFEDILRKTCELGVQSIYPILSERTEKSGWRSELWNKRQERFRRILQESCKQAKNPFLPQLHTVASFEQLPNMNLGHSYWGSLEATQTDFIEHKEETPVACIIGPEGGFSSQEEDALKQFATPIHLPTCVMRVETAVVGLISVLKTTL